MKSSPLIILNKHSKPSDRQITRPFLILLFSALLLTGCASQPHKPSTEKGTTHQELSAHTNHDLTADMVFDVLLGEVAAQRGEPNTALSHYNHATQSSNDPLLAERASQIALNTGNPVSIRQATTLWLKNAPDQITPHKILALLDMQDKNIDGATLHFKHIINAAKKAGKESYIQVANTLEKTNNPALSLTLMQKLTQTASNNPNAQLALAITATRAHRYDLANTALNKALLLKPKWPQALILLSKNALLKNNPAEAQRILKKALDNSPNLSILRYAYAQLLMETNHLTDSYEQFKILNKERPNHVNIIFTLGILAKQLDNLEQAKIHFKQLIRLKKRINDARLHLGEIEEHLGNNREAIEWYDQITGERAVRAQVRVAILLSREGETDKAREILKALRTSTPELAARIYLAEASLLMDAGDTETSMSIFNEAILQFPQETSLLYARSILHSTRGEIEQLENDLLKVIAIDPNHADALNALGYALADQTTRYSEALSYIERALKLKPNHPAILDSMGWVLFRLGRNDEALKYLQRAMQLQSDPEIAAHLGEVLWAIGKTTQARQVWNKALDSDPGSDYLNKVIRRYP